MIKKITIIVLSLTILGTGVYFVMANDGVGAVPISLEVKAPKERIIFNKEIDDVRCDDLMNCVKHGKAMKYWYAKETEILAKKASEVIPNSKRTDWVEDISARDYNRFVFRDGASTTAVFMGGIQMAKEKATGKWFKVKTATTTPKVFDDYMKISFVEKIIKKAFADETTFYPDADVESTSVDGYVYSGFNGFANAHESVDGNPDGVVSDSATVIYAWIYTDGGGNASLSRGFALFDTSAIPSGSTIDSAVFHGYADSKMDDYNDAQSYIAIVQSSPASDTALVQEDYNDCGATTTPDEGSDTQYDITSITTSAYNTWTFNSTGEGWISMGTGGMTRLGIREGHDTTNTDPGGSSSISRVIFQSADGTNSPKLVVNYSAGGGGGASWEFYEVH